MSNQPPNESEMNRLLSAWADDTLTDEDFHRLDQLLSHDDQARRLYVQFIDMHEELYEIAVPSLDEVGGRLRPRATPTSPRQRLSGWLFAGPLIAVALGVIGLGVGLSQFLERPDPRPTAPPSVAGTSTVPLTTYIATLQQTLDCQWRTASPPLRAGMRLPPLDLQLERGTAQIAFDSGAVLTITGPSLLVLEGTDAATLVDGTVHFESETGGTFRLKTPQSTLIDIGTEFVVSARDGSEQVRVFDGEIQRLARDNTRQRLFQGDAVRYDPAGPPAGEPIDLSADGYEQLRQLADPPTDRSTVAADMLSEGFAYDDPFAISNGVADGGTGWKGGWRGSIGSRDIANSRPDLLRVPLLSLGTDLGPGSANGAGMLQYPAAGGPPQCSIHRTVANAIDLSQDGIYYFSYRFQFDPLPDAGAAAAATGTNASVFILRSEAVGTSPAVTEDLRVVVHSQAQAISVTFGGKTRQAAIPLMARHSYTITGKIVSNATLPDQVLVRVTGARNESDHGDVLRWTLMSDETATGAAYDTVIFHVNSNQHRQSIDEFRLWKHEQSPH